MPSVGMRRSTRVLGARVLRSGRRLWTEPQHETGKLMRAGRENEWIEIVDSDGGDTDGHCKDVWLEDSAKDFVEKPKLEDHPREDPIEDKSDDIMYGTMYTRKRKRKEFEKSSLSEDKRFGKKFYRKQVRKKCRTVEGLKTSVHFHDYTCKCQQVAVIAVNPSYDSGFWIACFMASLLSYMRRVRLELHQLSIFVHSKPIFDAYSSHGVLFLQGCALYKHPGKCIISGSRSLIPVFAVDFSAVPLCFMHLHLSMHLRSAQSSYVFVAYTQYVDCKVEQVADMAEDVEEQLIQSSSAVEHSHPTIVTSHIKSWKDAFHNDFITSSFDDSRSDFPHSAVELPRSSSNGQRSILRRKRGRPPSSFRTQNSRGGSPSDLFRFRHNGVHFSAPSHVLRSSGKKSPTPHIKELKSSEGLSKDTGIGYSSANLLITETDKCYREEGFIITLERSASNLWSIVIVKDGVKRFSLAAQNGMRPSCCNRFTHAMMWVVNDGWKLEFPNRQDWLIFKELYKECSDRNELAPIASVIPVPGIQVVSCPVKSSEVLFVRPDSYITVKDDELVRALMKGTANYDMDSEDEFWLNEFNSELYPEREIHGIVTPETFELIVDALERGFHRYPDDISDDKAAYEFCMHLERKELVDSIHKYWIKKRRQKRSALVRIFQLYQPRRNQVIPKSILRKKRSFKRQASQVGRGKQRTLLQALASERDTLEQHNNMLKVQEAKTEADRSEHSAVIKRQRAQILMENADLLVYKAAMALRIAEAAQIAESRGTAVSCFLGSLPE